MIHLGNMFLEILYNVHIHSGKPLGTAITHFDAKKDVLREAGRGGMEDAGNHRHLSRFPKSL